MTVHCHFVFDGVACWTNVAPFGGTAGLISADELNYDFPGLLFVTQRESGVRVEVESQQIYQFLEVAERDNADISRITFNFLGGNS